MTQYVIQGGGRSLVILTAPAGPSPPAAPTGLTAVAASSSQINLNWSEGGLGSTGFVVQRSLDGVASWAVIASPGSTATSYTDTGLSASTLYYYRVAAVGPGGTSAYSAAASATTSGAGAVPSVLPTYVASAVSKAAANTSQWASYKSYLDTNLGNLIGIGAASGYQAYDVMLPAPGYALGYRCLAGPAPSTAYDYADKAIALIKAAVNDYMTEYASSSDRFFYQYAGVGDGSTAAFAIPNADYVAGSFKAHVLPLQTLAVTKGAANGVDNAAALFYGYKYTNGHVVNVTDSASDNWLTPTKYVKGVDWDWWAHYDDDQYKPQAMGPDWSFGTSNQPAAGATYYIRAYDVARDAQFSPGSGITLSGATCTFATPPAAGSGVFYQYVYGTRAGDFSTLSHQQTSCGDGGFWSISPDTTYNTRFMYGVALALDWLWDYPGFTSALKAQVMNMLVLWSDQIRDNGYYRASASSNYGVGGSLARAAIAAALQGRHSAASRLASEQSAFTASFVAPMLSAGPFTTTPDPGTVGNPAGTSYYADTYSTLHGGWWTEGLGGYGIGAVRDLMLGQVVLGGSGLATVTAARAWAAQAIQCFCHCRPTASLMLDFGDCGATWPVPSWNASGNGQAREVMYTLSAAAADPASLSYINSVIQAGPGAASNSLHDILFRNPSAPATDPATALPAAYLADGAGLLLSRADWTYASTWMALACGSPTPNDHQDMFPGCIESFRGADPMLISAVSKFNHGNVGAFGRSLYGNIMAIDDAGAGNLVSPYGMSYDMGPAVILKASDLATTYTFAEIDTRNAWSKPGTNQATNMCVESTRAVLHVRPDYIVAYDRVATTAGHNYAKRVQSYTSATPTVAGQSWSVAQGSSNLFGVHYSAVPTTVASSTGTVGGKSFGLTTAVPTTARDRWTVVTAYQQAPSSTASMDASAFVASGDGKVEGVLIGQVAALFGTVSDAPIALPTSYTLTAPSGTTTHHLCDVTPGRACTLSGAVQSTATASAGGVLSFTTAGAGPVTVTIS